MTTIATDGRVIAADGRTSAGSAILNDSTIKLLELVDGSVVGGAGRADDWRLAAEELNLAIAEGRVPKPMKGDYVLMRLLLDGRVFLHYDRLVPVEVSLPAAIGSGSDYARAFMVTGLSPVDAVRATKKLDSGTGGRIRSITVRP